ncbi:DUF3800 domain-containing protein [Autumnicola musiva]|uniref:DUF3800 domain-containing protein n=1 Tax=Autumnicola musiva TaxID=3075589 RepID=A0ABU3DBA3_9FLAO|nr:DUF3800 domain-containing protein [Zunongwangia sp. F117]MDT0678789.1 DUF3800 domain-containing protein [Zunongwangia sp. F117]
MSKAYIYFDEFGNPFLDTETKAGTPSHFIYTAVVIDESNLEKAKEIRQELSDKFRQGSPIKSVKVKIKNRLKMISEFKKMDFGIFSLVVDKRKIDNENLEDKTVFYKFFQRLFLTQFVERYDEFEIYFDKIGEESFRQSLRSYINRKVFQPTLFNPNRSYKIADDKFEEPLIQIADFFSGCVGKVFCFSHKDSDADKIFELINDRLFVDFYPFITSNYLGTYSNEISEDDIKIGKLCVKIVLEYLENENASNEEIELLKHLLLIYKTDPNRLSETYELVNILKRVNPQITVEHLREIISRLRFKGLIIVSIEGKYGYKIPNKKNDIIGYYNRYLKSIIPMLTKMRISNEQIKKEYFDIDIFKEGENLELIQSFINAMDYSIIE